jgi:hypothetical protein
LLSNTFSLQKIFIRLNETSCVITVENTLRERFSLGQFSAMLTQYMETWSNNYEANVTIMHDQPVVDLPLWTAAYQWAKLEKTIITENTTDCHIFYSPAKDKRDFTDNNMEINKEMKFNSFNEYKVAMFNIWTTNLPTDKEKWIDGKCNYHAYFKKRICKHVVGVTIRTKIAVPPTEAKAIPTGAKRRRGRPAKAKKP